MSRNILKNRAERIDFVTRATPGAAHCWSENWEHRENILLSVLFSLSCFVFSHVFIYYFFKRDFPLFRFSWRYGSPWAMQARIRWSQHDTPIYCHLRKDIHPVWERMSWGDISDICILDHRSEGLSFPHLMVLLYPYQPTGDCWISIFVHILFFCWWYSMDQHWFTDSNLWLITTR